MRWGSEGRITRAVIWLVITGVLFAAAVIALSIRQHATKDIVIADVHINANVADTANERVKGLSGTTSLSEGEGLLLVYQEAGKHGIWMKEMNYPLDIIWLDEKKNVVHIEKRVSPETYPQVFTPPIPTLYVLEVPSGFAGSHHLTIGATAFFVD